MEKIRTTIRIAGKDYNVAGYDTEEHVQRVAAYVDRKMAELESLWSEYDVYERQDL